MISLTSDQVKAIGTSSHRAFVLAPAGSGKTEVLVQRVLKILRESAGESFRVLALTYTLKAAEELRERVREAVGDELWRVDADTIHGFALSLLRRFGESVGFTGDPVVYSEDTDRLILLRRYFSTLPESLPDHRASALLARIDAVRTNLLPLDGLKEEFVEDVGLSVGDVYEGYMAMMSEANGVDFPGMLTKAIELVSCDERTRRLFVRTYRHVVIDEGQDLTGAQCALLKALLRDDTAVFIVGDERQSINSYAGGDIKWAWDLAGPSVDVLHLQHNFRSSQTILTAAARLAHNFATRRPEATVPPGTPYGAVSVAKLADEAAEARYVSRWVQQILKGLDPAILVPGESVVVAPEDVAVIARNRFALEPVRSALEAIGIRVSLQTAELDALRSSEARLFVNLLHLCVNENDGPSARRATEEVLALERDLAASSSHWRAMVERAEAAPIGALWAAVQACYSSDSVENLPALLDTVVTNSDGWDVDRRLLAQWVSQHTASTSRQERSAASFLQFLFRVQRTRPADPGVRLLTTHRAKGLEFTAVSLIGVAEGIVPDYRSTYSERAVDEERRTFYVALTRARRAVLITWPAQRTSRYGRRFSAQPSRFLDEAHLLDVAVAPE